MPIQLAAHGVTEREQDHRSNVHRGSAVSLSAWASAGPHHAATILSSYAARHAISRCFTARTAAHPAIVPATTAEKIPAPVTGCVCPAASPANKMLPRADMGNRSAGRDQAAGGAHHGTNRPLQPLQQVTERRSGCFHRPEDLPQLPRLPSRPSGTASRSRPGRADQSRPARHPAAPAERPRPAARPAAGRYAHRSTRQRSNAGHLHR